MTLDPQVIAQLNRDGWNADLPKLEALLECAEEDGHSPRINVEQIKRILLDTDIKDYAIPVFSNNLDKKKGILPTPQIVQLARWKNVSHPKILEHFGNDGLCKISLTDGFSTLEGLQVEEPLPGISGETPFGTKVLLTGVVEYEGGFLVLEPRNCRILGGQVEKQIEKWQAAKLSMKKEGKTIATDYPKFEPFQKRRADAKICDIEANLGSMKIDSSSKHEISPDAKTSERQNHVSVNASSPRPNGNSRGRSAVGFKRGGETGRRGDSNHVRSGDFSERTPHQASSQASVRHTANPRGTAPRGSRGRGDRRGQSHRIESSNFEPQGVPHASDMSRDRKPAPQDFGRQHFAGTERGGRGSRGRGGASSFAPGRPQSNYSTYNSVTSPDEFPALDSQRHSNVGSGRGSPRILYRGK